MGKVEMLNESVDNPQAVLAKFQETVGDCAHFVILAEMKDGSVELFTNNTTPKDRLMYGEILRDHAIERQFEL